MRVDFKKNKPSAIDFVRMVLECDYSSANTAVGRLLIEFPELCASGSGASQEMTSLHANQTRGGVTPEAGEEILVKVTWRLPFCRAASDIRRILSEKVCRVLGEDMSLVSEIEASHRREGPPQGIFENGVAKLAMVCVYRCFLFKFLATKDRRVFANEVVEQAMKHQLGHAQTLVFQHFWYRFSDWMDGLKIFLYGFRRICCRLLRGHMLCLVKRYRPRSHAVDEGMSTTLSGGKHTLPAIDNADLKSSLL